MKSKIVTIGGKKYDTTTGLPVEDAHPTPPVTRPKSPIGLHTSLQKSQTLVRRVTKKPIAVAKPPRKPGQTMDIARSRSISRFAPHPVITPEVKQSASDIPATRHPIHTKALRIQAIKHTPKPKVASLSSRELKDKAIAAALSTPTPKVAKKKLIKRHPRLVTIVTISIIIAIAVAYVTYINMPALSVRVAATQAGIDATYPQYRPDGYRIDGPITFGDGVVSIHFVANTGSTKFTITQAKSSWDSTAVLDNVVRKNTGKNYITSQERGLTIYAYDGNAAWVNAGIFYTITGDAPLSGDQIRRIATSM